MILRLSCLLTCILFTIGCGVETAPPSSRPPVVRGGGLYTPPEPPPSLSECTPSASVWSDVTELYLTTEQSIHELITCGRVQVQLARSMLAIVLACHARWQDLGLSWQHIGRDVVIGVGCSAEGPVF